MFYESGRSAAWLARYLGVVEVVGSNPAGPIELEMVHFRDGRLATRSKKEKKQASKSFEKESR